jgi:hypothetical protein
MAGFEIKVTLPISAWAAKLAGLQDRLFMAIDTTMNMVRGMLETAMRADIASAGNFGSRWTEGMHANLEGAAPNMRIYFTHDIPFAGIFERGGSIQGKPLLWLPLTGTDAMGVRASAFPDGLFAARYPRKSGPPLLFSLADKKPRYFGIPSVTIPQKFQLREDVSNVMENFRSVFDQAWKAA